MEEIKNIKRKHVLLVLLFIIVLLIPVVVIKGTINYHNNQKKDAAILFLKENINELEPICKQVLDVKKDECERWQNYSICYQDNGVLIDEIGLTSSDWVLWYLNDIWYYQIKPIDENSRMVIINE